jgi:hypothetical protein
MQALTKRSELTVRMARQSVNATPTSERVEIPATAKAITGNEREVGSFIMNSYRAQFFLQESYRRNSKRMQRRSFDGGWEKCTTLLGNKTTFASLDAELKVVSPSILLPLPELTQVL